MLKIYKVVLMLFVLLGTLILQPSQARAMNSVVDSRGGANQMPNEKCRRESAGNNDSERAARYEQCIARRKKSQ
jgi:hypothetical protein